VLNDTIRQVAGRHRATLVDQADTTAATVAGVRPPRDAVDRPFLSFAEVGEGPRSGTIAGSEWVVGIDPTRIPALRARARAAQAAGARLDAIAKVGDSNTATRAFLAPVTPQAADAARPGLAATVEFFDRSLVRPGLAAQPAWSTIDALGDGADGPLARELRTLQPAVAVVMLGTNDLTHVTLPEFEEALDRMLATLDRANVIALVSTIPPRTDDPEFGARVPQVNAAIRALTAAYGFPLVDYGAAMAELPAGGLGDDGIHPSVCPAGAGELSDDCLQYGHNLRNLLTLQALDRLRTYVLAPVLAQ
jgi:lysophospholipase L1-like esterase